MSSRSLSPPRRRRRGFDDDHHTEPSMTPLSLRPRRPSKPGQRAISMPVLSPSLLFRDRPSSPPPPPSYDNLEQYGLHTPLQPQHQEDSDSGSELDSPPRIDVITKFVDEPSSPTSPPPEFRAEPSKPSVTPKGNTFGSDTDTEEQHSLDAEEEDQYFNSLVDKFVVAAGDACKPTFPEDEVDKEGHQQQSDLFANSALTHYNNDEKNKIKYELIRAITSCGIMDEIGCYGHVNFTAKGNQKDSKEELFFAEVRREGYLTFVSTCVVSLEGGKSVGGLYNTRYDNYNGMGVPMDAQHCYACSRKIKHPKDGSLYECGHIANGDYYYG